MHNLGCLLYRVRILNSCPGLPVEREGSPNSKTKTSRGAVYIQMDTYQAAPVKVFLQNKVESSILTGPGNGNLLRYSLSRAGRE